LKYSRGHTRLSRFGGRCTDRCDHLRNVLIGHATAENQRANLMRKLRLKQTADLTQYAIRNVD